MEMFILVVNQFAQVVSHLKMFAKGNIETDILTRAGRNPQMGGGLD